MYARGLLLVLAGCGFQNQLVGGASPPDAAPTAIACESNRCKLRFDTAADFATDATRSDIGIERDVSADPNSARLTPAAYVRGAVIARGANVAFGAAAVDWAMIDAATPAGTAFATEADLVTLHAGTRIAPADINADWTYWIEGEIALPSGMTTFQIAGDDFVALQIAAPNTRAFANVVETDFQVGPKTALFDAGTGGWFPFRGAVVQTGGGFGLTIQIGDALGGNIVPIPRAKLRARVDDMRGAFVVAWDDRAATGPATPAFYTRPLLMDPIEAPLAAGLTGADDLSQRWFGQLRATVGGSYTITTTSDDGNRVWLAGQPSNDAFDTTGTGVMSTVTATLREGWNDLVIDYNQTSGSEDIQLRITAAPAGVTTNAPIMAAQLRPVMPVRRAYVTHFDAFQTPMPIPDNSATGIDVPFTFDAHGDETVREVRVTYDITHQTLTQVDVDLIHDGKTAVLRNNVGTGTNRYHKPITFDNGPLAGVWTLHVDDETGGQTGNVRGWSITVLTEGTGGQIATSAEWISGLRDLEVEGTVEAIDMLDASHVLPAGSSAAIYVRTCAEPIACKTASWSGPHTVGAITGVPKGRYAQVRVVLTSNGFDEPTLDFVEIDYRVAPR